MLELTKPLHAATLRVLEIFTQVAAMAGYPCLLVGATARDVLLYHRHGIPVIRATRDLDFAVAVESWKQFEKLKSLLIEKGEAIPTAHPHRLEFEIPDIERPYPVDLIPFGPIAGLRSEIAWPPDLAHVMSVVGYDEVMKASERLFIKEDLFINIASLPGLAILKLFAWQDRGAENRKDATDMRLITTKYADAGNVDRLYEKESALLEHYEFDTERAGAYLLGKDMFLIAAESTTVQLLALLTEKNMEQLAVHMMNGRLAENNELARIYDLLNCLKNGMLNRLE